MINNNSIYELTPPSLYLNDNGPSILALGFTEEAIRTKLCPTIDKVFSDTSITYYYNPNNLNESTIAWARSVVNTVDHIVINADTANELEVFVALQAVAASNQQLDVTWIAEEYRNKALCRIINSYRQPLLGSWEEYALMVDGTLNG